MASMVPFTRPHRRPRRSAGILAASAIPISPTHIAPTMTYSHFHETPVASRYARIAGTMIEPTPKKPSTVFMIDVCSAVDVEMSPMSASAPVLNTPMAMPDSPISTAKNRKVSPAAKRNEAPAKTVSPMMMVPRCPKRSASVPRPRPASAIPAIVAY